MWRARPQLSPICKRKATQTVGDQQATRQPSPAVAHRPGSPGTLDQNFNKMKTISCAGSELIFNLLHAAPIRRSSIPAAARCSLQLERPCTSLAWCLSSYMTPLSTAYVTSACIRAGVLAAARCCCCSWSGPAPAWRGTPAAAARSPSRRPAATTSCTSTTSRSHRRGLPFLAPLSCLACPVLLAPCLSFPSPFFVTFCCPSPPFPAFSPLPRSLPF